MWVPKKDSETEAALWILGMMAAGLCISFSILFATIAIKPWHPAIAIYFTITGSAAVGFLYFNIENTENEMI